MEISDTPRPVQLVQLTVPCRFDPTDEIIQVKVCGEPIAPGLAITPALHNGGFQGGWTLTHTPSGHSIVPRSFCLSCARTVAKKICDVADWTQPKDAALSDPAIAATTQVLQDVWMQCNGYLCRPYVPAKAVNA